MSLFAGVKTAIDVKASIKDQSGHTIKVDLREDEDSKEKLCQIIDLLLAAGYFRARISTLPPFDKVVGGLVWCISTCNVDLDVDLLYQENSTIGQKIALTEKIVAVLPRMKCPHELQPHQIQGMDCVKIFPVVQWLVKKAMERREETAQYIRSFSEMQFNKQYILPSDKENELKIKAGIVAMETYINTHRRNRIYKKPSNTRKLDIKLQTQSTLLEYGHLANLLEYSNVEEVEESESKVSPEELERRKEREQNRKQLNENNIKELLKNLSKSTPSNKPSISSSVGAILQTQSEEISKAADEYEEKQAVINEQQYKRDAMEKSHERTVRSLNNQVAQVEELLTKHAETINQMKENYANITGEIEDLDHKMQVATSKIEELEAVHAKHTTVSAAEQQHVEKLVLQHEQVVKEREQFKKTCVEKIKKYKEDIMETKDKTEIIENDKRTKMVAQQYEKDKAKLAKLRLQTAKKNYGISALQRQVDEIPSRIELIQYQKRFEELHQQAAKVHTETKQFYTLFNNLSDTKTYLEKHLVRLNSINENFTKAIGDIESGYLFLQQFEQLVAGAKSSKAGIEKKRDEIKENKDTLNDQYLQLVEQQRRYYAMVKEFRDECTKNEMLLSKCKAYGL